jgi:hypothetical protein
MSALGAAVSESRKFTSNIVIGILRSNLHPVAQKWLDFERDDELCFKNGLVCSPRELMNMVCTTQQVVFESHLACGLAEADEEAQINCYKDGDKYVNSVEVFIEFMRGKTKVEGKRGPLVGWRLHNVIHDTQFDFEKGLMALWEREGKKKTGKKNPNAPPAEKAIGYLRSKKAWIMDGISPYMGEVCGTNDDTRRKAMSVPLTDKKHPLRAIDTLTFERSCELFAGIADDSYLQKSRYYVPVVVPPPVSMAYDQDMEDEEEDVGTTKAKTIAATKITFPHMAYPIHDAMRDPKIIMRMDLSVEPEANAAENPVVLSRERRKKIKMIEEDQAEEENLVLKNAKAWWAEQLAGKSPVDQHKLRMSEEGMNMFRAVCFADDTNTGGMIANKWLEQKRRANDKFSVVPPLRGNIDAMLPEFGNFVAREMLTQDMTCGIAVLHEELLLFLLISLIAPDIGDEKLRFHTLVHGPPASGKSFLQEMLARLSLPGLMHTISVQTRKAMTTHVSYNNMLMVMDELNELMTSKGDGTGHADIKEILSKGRNRTEMCWIDEKGKRVILLTISDRMSPLFANTNLPMSALPEPMANRFYKRFAPEQRCARVNYVEENYQMKNDPERIKMLDSLAEQWSTMQALANLMWTMMRSGQMPRTDLKLANKLSIKTFEYLVTKHGIEVDKRDQERVMLLTEAVTIYYAITKVFMSGTVYPPGTVFKDEHVLSLIPFLTATSEHFYFALSLMHNIIVDSSLDLILKAINRIVTEETVESKKFASKKDKVGGIDYNYYSIPVSSMVEVSDITGAVADMLVGAIQNESMFTLCKKNMQDVLGRMCKQKKDYPQYNATGQLVGDPVRMSVAHMVRSGTKYGMEISRQYLDEMIKTKTDVMADVIKATFNEYMASDVIVMGETHRYGYEASPAIKKPSYPFLFKCVKVDKVALKGKKLHLHHNTYKRQNQDLILYNSEEAPATERTYEVTSNIEATRLQEWLAATGTTRPPDIVHLDRRVITKRYPESFMDAVDIMPPTSQDTDPNIPTGVTFAKPFGIGEEDFACGGYNPIHT